MRKSLLLVIFHLVVGTATILTPNCTIPDDLNPNQLTVLISGYSTHRLPLLRTLASFYATLPIISSVLILWGNPKTHPSLLTFPSTSSTAPIILIRNPTRSLNHRFHPHPQIRTLAVLICDDDIQIPSLSISFAFRTWQSHPDRIVGFFPRSHELDLESKSWIYTIHPDKHSIVLTKMMIVASEYLWKYTCIGGGSGMERARSVVKKERNCEDLLINFVVAMDSRKGPLLVGSNWVRDWGDTRNEKDEKIAKGKKKVAISEKEGHRRRRGMCIGEFHKALGIMPLRYSYGNFVEGVKEQGLCQKSGKLVRCDQVGRDHDQ